MATAAGITPNLRLSRVLWDILTYTIWLEPGVLDGPEDAVPLVEAVVDLVGEGGAVGGDVPLCN